MSSDKTNHFNFKEFEDEYLLTNDTGKFLFLSKTDFHRFIENDYTRSEDLLNRLVSHYFVYNTHREIFVDNASFEVRKQKNYLFEGTQLHIFVLTKECNQKCIYCQASANSVSCSRNDMTVETAEKAIDIAFQSPSRNLSFEFQGGEPLLNFKVLKHIVEYAQLKNTTHKKNINFNLVSNLIVLDETMIDFLLNNNISICTSLDGHEVLHKQNRPCSVPNFYNKIKENIYKINTQVSTSTTTTGKVQAIQTTTRYSLKYPKEIVDEYVSQGFNSLFLRPLTPLGFAQERWDVIGYTPEEFLLFYKKVLEYIIELSITGISISETYASILLKKILNNSPLNYMELRSPCGGAIGQLAYHYDGNIYTCDEGRMLSESGDDSFKLGNVYSTTYNQLIENPITKALCISSCLETIPGCSECVYSPYCGTCPILNYVQSGSIFAIMPSNYKCKINKGILDFLFSKIKENDERVLDIFKQWAN